MYQRSAHDFQWPCLCSSSVLQRWESPICPCMAIGGRIMPPIIPIMGMPPICMPPLPCIGPVMPLPPIIPIICGGMAPRGPFIPPQPFPAIIWGGTGGYIMPPPPPPPCMPWGLAEGPIMPPCMPPIIMPPPPCIMPGKPPIICWPPYIWGIMPPPPLQPPLPPLPLQRRALLKHGLHVTHMNSHAKMDDQAPTKQNWLERTPPLEAAWKLADEINMEGGKSAQKELAWVAHRKVVKQNETMNIPVVRATQET